MPSLRQFHDYLQYCSVTPPTKPIGACQASRDQSWLTDTNMGGIFSGERQRIWKSFQLLDGGDHATIHATIGDFRDHGQSPSTTVEFVGQVACRCGVVSND